MKKTISLILSLVMILTLCACGNKSAAAEKPSADATPALEYVYTSDFTTLAEKSRNYYSPMYYTENGLYASGYDIVGSSAPEGVTEEYFGQYDITENRIFFIDFDGGIKKLPNYEPLPAEECGEGQYDFNSSDYISGISVNSSGNLAVMEAVYTSWNDTDGLSFDDSEYYDHYHFTQKYFFRELTNDGAEIGHTELELSENEWIYATSVLDAEGNFLATKSSDDNSNSILGIGTDGEIKYEIPVDDYPENFFNLDDGSVYALVWGDGLEMRPIDPQTHKLGDGTPLPGDAYNIYSGGGDYPLYYTSGSSFYGLNPETGESTKLFSWLDCDINPDDVWNIGISSSGIIHLLVSDFDSFEMVYNIELASVRKAPYNPSNAKKELTLATQYLGYELRRAVIDFNRKSADTRIVVKDYSEYNTEDDYSAGTTKMTTEIIAGNAPDIIDLSGMPATQFASKGILEDLYPFFENDREINRADYFDNVLAAAEYNGKLIHTVSYFYLQTVAGAASLVGDTPGWNYDEFNAALNALREDVEDASAFDAYTTRDDILNTCLALDMHDFVNWSTGEVDFNNQEFCELLKFASQFPAEYNWDEYSWETDSVENRISQGKQMLYRESIGTMDTLMYLECCFKGTPLTFIGYPTFNGIGNTIAVDSGFAMTSSCKDKDAAWQFLRTLMSSKYYKNTVQYMGLPAIKTLFDKALKDATTVQYKIGNDGQYVLDDEGNRIPSERYFAIGTDMYTYYALSEDVAQAFREAVTSCDRVSDNDNSIIDIVKEESAAFFSGQKSAEDVAKLVQSKAFIYVNE